MTEQDETWTRRRFIKRSGMAAAGAAALVSGACADNNSPIGTPMDATPDELDAIQDISADQIDEVADASAANALSKMPFVQLVGATAAQVRFETLGSQPLAVQLKQVSGSKVMQRMPKLDTRDVSFEWPPAGSFFRKKIDHYDDAGIFSVQDARFDDLTPGERYRWSVDLGGGAMQEGEFIMSKPREERTRLGWISDTMFPNAQKSIDMLLAQSPDMIMHGGDFQYMTNPFDTWTGMFHAFKDLTASAPMHMCIGNHEYEDQDEFSQQYERLFNGQGWGNGNVDYHIFDYGLARVLMLNSEIEIGPDSPQYIWADQQLTRANEDNRAVVVVFHRPYYTFSSAKPRKALRDALHPLFVRHNVRIVLNGHNHCFERFVVDDIVYVVDGGGGSLLYNSDLNLADVLDTFPGDADLRKVAYSSYGVSTLDVMADGTMNFRRISAEGTVQDEFTLG